MRRKHGVPSTSSRKLDHLRICAEEDVESHYSYFNDIMLIHEALPEINKGKIELETAFLGKKLNAPFLISSMTGGHPETAAINTALAEAAEELQIAIGVGSQRAALEDTRQEESYRVVREKAPTTFIHANIGAPQLSTLEDDDIQRLIDMIDADALAIHLNFLQEAIQPDGDVNAEGCLHEIERICKLASKPVIVKETGAGISRRTAEKLKKAGVAAIDVAGTGGTSWSGVEVYRARGVKDKALEHLGELYWDWGVPTPVSIIECKTAGLPIIASGGLRSGLDAAKSIALGAALCGAALPYMKAAMKGSDAVIRCVKLMMDELRAAMFLTQCMDMKALGNADLVVTGKTKEILNSREFS